MSYAQVAQHHKDNAQKEKQKNEKQINEPAVTSSNGKFNASGANANTASGKTTNDTRDSRGKFYVVIESVRVCVIRVLACRHCFFLFCCCFKCLTLFLIS